MSKVRRKGFSIVEFLVASSLTLLVVGSSTLAITISQKQQQVSFYNDLSYSIGNSIIQQSRAIGCGMANGDQNFSNKIFSSCKAKFDPNGETELNTQFPASNTTISNLINIPATDGDNYVYSISNSVKLKIIYRTAWLNSNTISSYGSTSAVTNACQQSDTQPDIFRRELNIFTIKNDKIVNARTLTDFQTIRKQSGNFNSLVSGSIQITENTKKRYYKMEPNSGVVTTGQTIYRLPDQNNCAWFGYLPDGKDFKFSSDVNASGKVKLITKDTNDTLASLS